MIRLPWQGLFIGAPAHQHIKIKRFPERADYAGGKKRKRRAAGARNAPGIIGGNVRKVGDTLAMALLGRGSKSPFPRSARLFARRRTYEEMLPITEVMGAKIDECRRRQCWDGMIEEGLWPLVVLAGWFGWREMGS